MSIGLGVFLAALGAVLAFAVQDRVPGIDLVMIGYICMAAGVVTIILSLVLVGHGRHRTHVAERERHASSHDPYGRR